MAQRHYLTLAAGSTIEVTSRVALEGWELTEKAEEGAVGSGTMWLADPAMDLDVDGLRAYTVIEDTSEATDNVLFGGVVVDPELSRGEQGGMHYDPVGRNWQLQLADRNERWSRRVLKGTDCKRPEETDIARVNWLMGTSESDWIDDDTTYVVSTGGSNMDKVDYRGQYAKQVIDDASQHTGRNWWVQVQETGTGREDVAWYGKDSRTVYSSDLYLSNDPADWDDAELLAGTSLVWPLSADTKLKRDTSRVYTGVYLRYANQKAIYRYNATTGAVYGRRDHVADYPNVKTKAKAIARATRLLDDLGTPDERITTTVVLPAAKASMIRAGMRVRVKGTHLEGYDDQFYWMRVLECRVSPRDAGTRYALGLVLQASGSVAAGNGPYTGNAFAAILEENGGSLSFDAGTQLFTSSGDSPETGGWYAEPTVGAMWTLTDNGAGKYSAISTSVAMRARVQAATMFTTVADAGATAAMELRVNGVAVGTDSETKVGGLSAWSGSLEVDLELDLEAGDTLTVYCTQTGFAAGYFGNLIGYTNTTFLRVGRGYQDWEGSNFWVGA